MEKFEEALAVALRAMTNETLTLLIKFSLNEQRARLRMTAMAKCKDSPVVIFDKDPTR